MATDISTVIVVGVLYSLQAVSFVLIVRSSGVFNFALGQFMVLGGYVFFFAAEAVNGSTVVGFIAMLASAAVAACAVYWLILKRLQTTRGWVSLVALFALSTLMASAMQLFWGTDARILQPLRFRPVDVLGAKMDTVSIAVVIVGTITLVVLFVITYGTRLGLRMRAAAEDAELTSYWGVRVGAVALGSWILAIMLAMVAGLVFAARTSLSPDIGQQFLVAFPAVVIGGFESLPGAVVGSFILAIVTQLAVQLIGTDLALPVAYLFLFVVLIFRPYGLFGSRSEVRI